MAQGERERLLRLLRVFMAETHGTDWEHTLLAPARRAAGPPPVCNHSVEGRARQVFERLRHHS